MTAFSHGQIARIVGAYDFSKFQTVADIGGGRGHLLEAVLAAASNTKGVLFDLPNVIDQASAVASNRLSLQAGDVFKDDLPVCDAYIIKHVIHDWSDEESITILEAIHRAAPEHAKLLLIELLIPDDGKPSWTMMIDILMLANLTGRERTKNEYNELLAGSGFRLERIIDTGFNTFIFDASATSKELAAAKSANQALNGS